MQTFLPYPDFTESAKVLDYRRLGKQRVEALQIYRVITGQSTGWQHHPAVKMWDGYKDCLAFYHNVMIAEWMRRGYNNSMRFIQHRSDFWDPPWLGDHLFHSSHRSNLLRKDPEYYGQFGWSEPDNYPYEWPKVK